MGQGDDRSAEDRLEPRSGLTRWDFGDLPDAVTVREYGTLLALYPALVDVEGRVDLDWLPPGPAAERRHRDGVRRLLLKGAPQQAELIRRLALDDRALLLAFHGVGPGEVLADDLLCASADEAFALDPPIRTAAAFAACLDGGRADLVPAAERLVGLLREVLAAYRALAGRLEAGGARGGDRAGRSRDRTGAAGLAERAVDDMGAQLTALVHPYFLRETPSEWRRELPRYLKAIGIRLDKLAQRAPKDAEHQAVVERAAARLDAWRARQPPDWPWPAAVVEYRWLLEELRVSLFAQSLGTRRPVSAKRLEEAWERAIR